MRPLISIANSNFIFMKIQDIMVFGFYFRGKIAFAVSWDSTLKQLRVASQNIQL